MNTGRFLSIPAEEYHAASRRGRYMSSLLAAIRESPELYRRKTSGEIVSSKDYGFIVKLQKSVWMHTAASALLDDGIPKATVRVEYSGVPGQMRMDWFSGEYGIVAPKTCDSLKWFEGDCKRFGYLFQMAFYHAVLQEATGESVAVRLIAVEKNEPFSTGKNFRKSCRTRQRRSARPLSPAAANASRPANGRPATGKPRSSPAYREKKTCHCSRTSCGAARTSLLFISSTYGQEGVGKATVGAKFPLANTLDDVLKKPGGTQGRAARVQDRGAGLRRLA